MDKMKLASIKTNINKNEGVNTEIKNEDSLKKCKII